MKMTMAFEHVMEMAMEMCSDSGELWMWWCRIVWLVELLL